MFGDNVTDLIGSCMSICADNREIMEGANVGDSNCGAFGCVVPSGHQEEAGTPLLLKLAATIRRFHN
jgi:hypothetical protein